MERVRSTILSAICAAAVTGALTAGGCASDEPGLGGDRLAEVQGTAGMLRNSNWRYWDRGGDLGSAWRGVDYDDSSWGYASGALGYGEPYLWTTIGYGGNANAKYITSYFRAEFTLTDPTRVTRMLASLMYDDGVVVYLNGHEIERRGVPAPSTAATLAAGHEAAGYQSLDWSSHLGDLVAGVNQLAVEVHQQAASSSDLVFDLGLELEFALPPSNGVPRGSVWSYWDRGGDLGSGWRAPAYDDAGWARAHGPLGYGEPYLATTIGYGPSASSKYITTYFRTDFTVDDPAAVQAITGELMYDDGLVIYLNGHEIGREGVAAGQTASTLASGHEAGNAYETFDWTAQRPHLVAGVNTLAVEVHQQAASSGDLVFDLSLALDVSATPPPPGDDIARGSTWAYWDRGGDLGSGWRARTFDDGAWADGAGPLGYGETYVATTIGYGGDASHKYITSYFRRAFTIADPMTVTAMNAELMYDDGVVVYLNGTEVKRLHMPTGTITASTLSPGGETGNRYESYDLSANRNLLVAGTNVIAVEVHQAQPTSSDLTFDLALTVTAACASAPIAGFTGTSDEATFASGGGGEYYRADVHWTLARTEGCVDHYTPSGTAHDLDERSYCFDIDPRSAPIEPGDGELVIDRSASPATYTMHGLSEWTANVGCSDPNDENYGVSSTTVASEWASDDRGSFDGAVISGGLRPNDGELLTWHFTADGVGFPAPAADACVEAASDRWHTLVTAGNGLADITWTRTSTTGCVDRYAPAGTARLLPLVDDSPFAFCRVRSYSPDSAPIESDDGELVIDRSVNPPRWDIRGTTHFASRERCERPDGSVQFGDDFRNVSLGSYAGAYQGNRWSGMTKPESNLSWDFTRL
jgi:hypothetical protein